MRIWKIVCALATTAGVTWAQQTGSPTATRPASRASAAYPDTLRLTRSAAVAAALANNPQLEVAREQTSQARARRVQAVAIPDPTLVASLDQQPGFLRLGQAGEKNVEMDLSVPFPDKFRLYNRIATADVESSDYQFTLLRQQVAADVARAYDDLLLTRRHRRDLLDGRALADSFLTRAQARFNAGTVAKLDVIKARVDVAQADNDLIANERDIANAESALNRLLGRSLGASIIELDSLDVPRGLPDLGVLESTAMTARPELGDLMSQRNGARANTALAREFWLPDLFVGATRDYNAPGSQAYSAGIGLAFPLFFWQHTRGEIAESQHRERELAAAYQDLRAEVGQDVRQAYASAETALRQALYIRDELLPATQEAFRVASVSYGLGGSSALEVLDARRTLLDAQSQYAEALANANSARSDLERAVGRPLDSFPTGDARE